MTERFRILIRKLGFKTDVSFADATGIKRSRLAAFLSGQTKYPTIDMMISIKKRFPEVNLNALVGFEGPLLFTSAKLKEQETLDLQELSQPWRLYLEELKKENEHLRHQNQQFMQLLQKKKKGD